MTTSEDQGLKDALEVLGQHGGVQKIWCRRCHGFQPVVVNELLDTGHRKLCCGKCHRVIAAIKEN